jgi:beta-mannosidase
VTSLGSDSWELYRAPLRDEGSRHAPALELTEAMGAVTVPGNLQLQLKFEDPWLDVPELTRLNHFEWLYTRSFTTPEHDGSRVFLTFAGVDYFTDVWVNGTHVAHHEGAFSQWEADITAALGPGGESNELVLAISCPWRVDARAFFLQPSTVFSVILKNSEYMKGNLLHYWDGLPLSGNAVFPFGPWRDIQLECRSGPTLRRTSVSTLSLDDGGAELQIDCEWWSDAVHECEVELELSIAPETFSGPSTVVRATVRVAPGDSESQTRATLEEPHLWWTWDTGEQDLYRATVDAGSAGTSDTVFGVRLLERDPESLAYSLNGQRLFLRGVWYPFANIFSAAPSALEHWRDVEMLRDGNNNHIVSFTFVEKDALYDACDRLGMLVFQELPYHQLGPMRVLDPAYPRFQEYWQWSLGEVENIVKQLRGHASVVLWAAFAETRKQERWVWGDYTDYSAAIGEIVRRHDPDAIYHPSFCDFKEEHIWNGGFPFGEFSDHHDRNHHFISEFGAIAPPVVETLREFMGPEAIWDVAEGLEGRLQLPVDAEEYSYRWAFDYAGMCTSVARMFKHVDRAVPTLERFVDAIQWYQAFGLRYCAEVYRRKRFSDITGCRTWSYRENVPGIKFTVVDHRQRPKLGYFGLKQAYEPILLSIDDREPLRPRGAGSRYQHDIWLVNDTPRSERLDIDVRLLDPSGGELATWSAAATAGGDSGQVLARLDLELPREVGPYLVRSTARRRDGSQATASESWVHIVRPAFDRDVRVLVLGQARYNAPILEALRDVSGVVLEVVDETNRVPQDSSWSEGLEQRVDVVWFAGWDYAAHQFREREWANIAAAVAEGVGLVHTGGQASFHGGDGRGALLDSTPLGDVLPVSLRPHDGVWDRTPVVEAAPGCSPLFAHDLSDMPFRGFSRTTARPGTETHWMIGRHPLLVTGRHGEGRTVAFTGSFTKPLRMFRVGEGLDWEDPLDVEPHWARRDIRAYGPYWRGVLELALGLLAHAGGRPLTATPAVLADEVRTPLFERLAGLPETTLDVEVTRAESVTGGGTSGTLIVTNTGGTVARLVRGTVVAGGERDHRFRDGFVDLMPGERASLRFEAGCDRAAIDAVEVRGQNARPTRAALPEGSSG